MKRILCIFMALAMSLAMVSCSRQNSMPDPGDTGITAVEQTQDPEQGDADTPSGDGKGPIQPPMNGTDDTGDPTDQPSLEVRINWLKGYQEHGPRKGKIEVVMGSMKGRPLTYHLKTEIGQFARWKDKKFVELGSSCVLEDLSDLYIIESPDQFFLGSREGLFAVDVYDGEKLVTTCSRSIYYSDDARVFYTLMDDGIPAIPNPAENGYAFFSIIGLEEKDLSTSALLSRFGDLYTVKQTPYKTLYIYDFGLILCEKEKGKVSSICLGDFEYYPSKNEKKQGDILEEDGPETAILYKYGILNGIYIENRAKDTYLNAMPEMWDVGEWELVDLSGDGRDEIYISCPNEQKLYTVKEGKLVEPFLPLHIHEQTGRISWSLEGKELTVSIDESIRASCTLPDRLSPEDPENNRFKLVNRVAACRMARAKGYPAYHYNPKESWRILLRTACI